MQVTKYENSDGLPQQLKEFFEAETEREIIVKMESRLKELKGHTLIKRIKIGRNAKCPCGSGQKFKKCCIDKVNKPQI